MGLTGYVRVNRRLVGEIVAVAAGRLESGPALRQKVSRHHPWNQQIIHQKGGGAVEAKFRCEGQVSGDRRLGGFTGAIAIKLGDI